MKISGIIFPSFNSTDGISVDIFLSGCKREPKCKNCHNSHLWNFNEGVEINYNNLINWLSKKEEYYDNITIMGGEPLHNKDLNILLEEIKTIKPIWLYTSYELNEIPNDIKKLCTYIKTGKYIEELRSDNNIQYGIKLASDNQKIIKTEEC